VETLNFLVEDILEYIPYEDGTHKGMITFSEALLMEKAPIVNTLAHFKGIPIITKTRGIENHFKDRHSERGGNVDKKDIMGMLRNGVPDIVNKHGHGDYAIVSKSVPVKIILNYGKGKENAAEERVLLITLLAGHMKVKSGTKVINVA